jgi:hypothetical protein
VVSFSQATVIPFTHGINYPWTVFDGRPNYGCDFGLNVWGSRAGVTAHQAEVRRDFEAMAAMGVEVARWFVFTDGRGGIAWDVAHRVSGLADGVIADLDCALEIAVATRVRLCLVLFDYAWMVHREERDSSGRVLFTTSPAELGTPQGRARILEHVVDPIVARYGHRGDRADLGAAIHSFDVINEPDWVARGLALDRRRQPGSWRPRVPQPFTLDQLRALVRSVADRVHAATNSLVTVGGGRVRVAAEWDDPAYGLDFIQVHTYPDRRHPERDRSVIGLRCSDLRVSKPVLIGECPANGDRLHPDDVAPMPHTLSEYVDAARAGGYLGAWPWSFKGVDGFGAVPRDEFATTCRLFHL